MTDNNNLMYNSWLEISQSAILCNLAQFQKIVGPKVEIMPIIKSNAYGHGMVGVAKILSPKVKWLGVVSLGEALTLRKAGIKNRILVLSYIDSTVIPASSLVIPAKAGIRKKNSPLKIRGARGVIEGIKQNLDLLLYDFQTTKCLSDIAKKIEKLLKNFYKIKNLLIYHKKVDSAIYGQSLHKERR